MSLTLTEDEADTLRAVITAIELNGAWGAVSASLIESGIEDPEGAFEALRDKAFS